MRRGGVANVLQPPQNLKKFKAFDSDGYTVVPLVMLDCTRGASTRYQTVDSMVDAVRSSTCQRSPWASTYTKSGGVGPNRKIIGSRNLVF